MTRYVVDASVCVKWFIPEIHSESALRFASADCELLAPDLLRVEIGNIIWKKVRAAELTRRHAGEILQAFRGSPVRFYSSETLIESAVEIACDQGRSVYDSLYLALAVVQQCQAVTADRKLYNALQGGPLASSIHWIENGP